MFISFHISQLKHTFFLISIHIIAERGRFVALSQLKTTLVTHVYISTRWGYIQFCINDQKLLNFKILTNS